MKMKKTAVILTGVLALTAVAPIAASAQSSIEPTTEQTISKAQQIEINSPKDYINWLKGQDGAEDAAQKFSDLSQADQEKFIKYINDPEINNIIMNAITTSRDNTCLIRSDITVKTEETVTPGKEISPQAKDYAIQQRATSTIMGIDVVRVSERVEYRVEGTPSNRRVSEVLNGGGVVDRYLIPLGRINVTDCKGYVNSRGLATQRSVFTTSFVNPKFVGSLVGTNDFTVWGNVYGQSDGWQFY